MEKKCFCWRDQISLNDLWIKVINFIQKGIRSMDQQAARAAAKRLYQKVNLSGGPLQSYEVSSLLTDTYEYLKIPFKPNSNDIKMYTEVLDANKDGQVTLADLETLALQYLCGPGVLQGSSVSSTTKIQQSNVSGTSSQSYFNSYAQLGSQVEKNIGLSNGISQSISPSKQQTKHISPQRTSYSPQGPSVQPAQREYNEQTMHYLSITKQIFQRNASQYGTITTDRVPNLLTETYQLLGRKGYSAGRQDVNAWMRLCDENKDGHVEYQQYCYFVLRQLEQAGYEIYR